VDWNHLQENWEHVRDRIRSKWGRLTQDDADFASRDRDALIRKIEDVYGISAEEAEAQLEAWEREHGQQPEDML
jgi:uncharacterized protein YjbJ (UPF0337 family)